MGAVVGDDVEQQRHQGRTRGLAYETRRSEHAAGASAPLVRSRGDQDDVLSELDGSRQNHLLSGINHIQTMITCTGLEDFVNNRFRIDKIFKVVSGEVYSEN